MANPHGHRNHHHLASAPIVVIPMSPELPSVTMPPVLPTVAELEAMTVSQLKGFLREQGVAIASDWRRTDLLTAALAAAGEVPCASCG